MFSVSSSYKLYVCGTLYIRTKFTEKDDAEKINLVIKLFGKT